MISVSRFIIAPHSPPPSLNTCGKGLGEEEEEDPLPPLKAAATRGKGGLGEGGVVKQPISLEAKG